MMVSRGEGRRPPQGYRHDATGDELGLAIAYFRSFGGSAATPGYLDLVAISKRRAKQKRQGGGGGGGGGGYGTAASSRFKQTATAQNARAANVAAGRLTEAVWLPWLGLAHVTRNPRDWARTMGLHWSVRDFVLAAEAAAGDDDDDDDDDTDGKDGHDGKTTSREPLSYACKQHVVAATEGRRATDALFFLLPEEALFLVDTGSLLLYPYKPPEAAAAAAAGTMPATTTKAKPSMSVADAYSALLALDASAAPKHRGIAPLRPDLPSYVAFSYMRSRGYIAVRPGQLRRRRQAQVGAAYLGPLPGPPILPAAAAAAPPPALPPTPRVASSESGTLTLVFDVYAADKHFSRRQPPPPAFRLAVCDYDDALPSQRALSAAVARCGPGVPLAVCAIQGTTALFYDVDQVVPPAGGPLTPVALEDVSAATEAAVRALHEQLPY